MTSTVNTLPLDATDTNVNVDDIDADIATSIVGSEVKEESRAEEHTIPSSGLPVRHYITEAKTASTTKTTSMDTAKSLNESNNKIIKELDDETAKTFPQIVSRIELLVTFLLQLSKFILNVVFASEQLISIFIHYLLLPFWFLG